MRSLGPAVLVSVALWASVVWVFVAVRTLVGCDHLHLCARELGAYLLCIDLVLVGAKLWFDRLPNA